MCNNILGKLTDVNVWCVAFPIDKIITNIIYSKNSKCGLQTFKHSPIGNTSLAHGYPLLQVCYSITAPSYARSINWNNVTQTNFWRSNLVGCYCLKHFPSCIVDGCEWILGMINCGQVWCWHTGCSIMGFTSPSTHIMMWLVWCLWNIAICTFTKGGGELWGLHL